MDYKDIFQKAITTTKNRFVGEENTEELKERVRNLLSVDGMEIINVRGTVQKFEATVIVKIDSINNFIKCYCDQNNETLRLSTINKYSRFYRCKHKTRHEKTKEVCDLNIMIF